MTTRIMINIILLAALLLLLPVQSFLLQPAQLSRSSSFSAIGGVQKNQNNAKFSTQTQWMSSDDDDDYIDEDSLGDWRSFRMNLANSVASGGSSSSGGVTFRCGFRISRRWRDVVDESATHFRRSYALWSPAK